MAETGFNTQKQALATSFDMRELRAERAKASSERVQPADETVRNALNSAGQELYAAEIERLSASAFKNSRLQILRDQDSSDFVYMMIDTDTGEAVRRWPPETHAELLEYLRTQQAGLLNQRA